jgi:DNA-binding transcriptional ArsR family regulator
MSTPFLVDVSPVYDLLLGMALVAHPPRGEDRWAIWAREMAAAMEPSARRRLIRWFNDDWPLGVGCVALVPAIAGEHDIPAFLSALKRLPLPDFLRMMVSSGELAVAPPLGASDLLALVGNRRRAQEYVDRYTGLTGHARSSLIHLLHAPESARHELLELLSDFVETSFAPIEPALRDERVPAGEALTQASYRLPDAPPEWLGWIGECTQPVLAPAALLADKEVSYYHELDRSLFDGMSYEPLISIVSTRRILAPPGSPRRPGRPRAPALASPEPIEKWARLYSALADPSCLRIARLLLERPRYGGELAALLNMSGATVSHHVGTLSEAGVLQRERRGQRVYFHIQSEAMLSLLDGSRRFLFRSDPPPEMPPEIRPDRNEVTPS